MKSIILPRFTEILIGKTILEALNTDLVCDAINTAMRELFLQIGRIFLSSYLNKQILLFVFVSFEELFLTHYSC